MPKAALLMLMLAAACLAMAAPAFAAGPSGSTECHLADDDCDGAIDEDPAGDANGDGLADDDGDGAADEDAAGDAADDAGENQVDCNEAASQSVGGVTYLYVGANGIEGCADDGSSLPIDGRAAATFAIADTLRDNAAAVVHRLRSDGLRVTMLSGDRRQTAEAIGRQVGITDVIAEVLPDGKVAAIRKLQQAGRRVAMVGDGLNDAPALAQADVGIAMASGTDIAAEAADVTLMRSDLIGVPQALILARRTMRTMKENLFWAFIYNVIGIPVAAGVLYPAFGILLSPVLASAAMAFSSVSVVTNSLRLRRLAL